MMGNHQRKAFGMVKKKNPVAVWLTAVVGIFAVLIFGCCGMGGLSVLLSPVTVKIADESPIFDEPQASAPDEEVGPSTEPLDELDVLDSIPLKESEPDTDPVVADSSPQPEPRTWNTSDGNNTIEARLTNYVRESETVELENVSTGKRGEVPLASLSLTDREYVKAIWGPPINEGAEVLVGMISRTKDGDTIDFKSLDGRETTIRLEGVDAPEKAQRFGEESTEWISRKMFNKIGRAEITGKDRYGRSLGYLYVGDDWVNEDLLTAGLAWHYVKYNKDTRLAEAQQTARRLGRGLWADARKVAPWDYRNGQRVETALPANVESTREDEEIVYITDTGTKYHRESCRFAKKSHYPIPLSRATSAYEPCKVCNPKR